MDERMMHLFSLIAEQVRTKQELFEDEGKIMNALLESGCPLHEANAALQLMQALSRATEGRDPGFSPPAAARAMDRLERRRFTAEAFGFVLRLVRLGVVAENVQEDIFERALDLYPDRIELDHIKVVTALVLFTAAGQASGNLVWH